MILKSLIKKWKKNKKNYNQEDENHLETESLEEDENNKKQKGQDGDKTNIEKNEENIQYEQINKLSLEIEEAIEQKQRALAEAENTRRRSSKDLEQARKYGHLSFSRDMLTVIDSLEKAVNTIPDEKSNLTDEIKNFIIGIEMTLEQIKQVYSNYNIVQINPEGEKFDYNLHQAMFEKETKDVDPGVIVEVLQPGWMLHDRLLRPAMVGVSKEPTKDN